MIRTFLIILFVLGCAFDCEARWANVRGHVCFQDGDPLTFPASGVAPVPALSGIIPCKDAELVSVVIQAEGSPHSSLGATNSRGNFNFPVFLTDNQTFTITLEVNNFAVHVMADTDGGNESYLGVVGPLPAGSTGDVDVGEITALATYEPEEITERGGDPETIMISFAAALNINSIILGVREDVESHRGSRPGSDTIGPVSVEYCDQANPFYFADLVLTCASMNGASHGNGVDQGFVDQTIAHEYGHHLEYEIGRYDAHIFEKEHGDCKEIDGVASDPEFAWSEGFADFIAFRTVFNPDGTLRPGMAAADNGANSINALASSLMLSLETRVDNRCRDASGNTQFQSTSNNIDEERFVSVESTVSGVLWDLYDPFGSGNDAWDMVDGGEAAFTRIIEIFDNELDPWGAFFADAPDLMDFYDAWLGPTPVHPDRQAALDAILNAFSVVPAGENSRGNLKRMTSSPIVEANPALPRVMRSAASGSMNEYLPSQYRPGSLTPLTITREFSFLGRALPAASPEPTIEVRIGVTNLGTNATETYDLAGPEVDTAGATFATLSTQPWLVVGPSTGTFSPQRLERLTLSFLPAAFDLPAPRFEGDRPQEHTADVNVSFQIRTETGTRTEMRTIRVVFRVMDGPDSDFDSDGLSARRERELAAADPGRSGCLAVSNLRDSDGDGLNDAEEALGTGRRATSPCDPDTDDDGVSDRDEVFCFGDRSLGECTCFDPLRADTNATDTADPDMDGVTNERERVMGTHPCRADSDSDCVNDLFDNCPLFSNPRAPLDRDGDGIPDPCIRTVGAPPQGDLDGDGRGDACDNDADGDGCEKPFDANDLQPSTFCELMTARGIRGALFVGEDPRMVHYLDGVRGDVLNPCGPRPCPPPGLITTDQNGDILQRVPASRFGLSDDSRFGAAALMLADLDKDGASEIAIGAPGAMNGRQQKGAGVVVIVSGKTGKLVGRFEGSAENARFGSALAVLDDKRLAIGEPGAGRVIVVSLPDQKTVRTHLSKEPKDDFGATVVAARDFNGDGENDLIVGAPNAKSASGSVYLAMSGDPLILLGGGAKPGDRFGDALLSVGDTNRDGVPEVLVGAPGAMNLAGEIVLLSFSGKRQWTKAGSKRNDRLGAALSVAARSKKDGRVTEFLVGAPGAERVLAIRVDGSIFGFVSGKSGEQFGSALRVRRDGSFAIFSPGVMEANQMGRSSFFQRKSIDR